MCEWSFLSFLWYVSAAELFRYDLISFDGISYKSGNTSEYKLRDKPEPEALTSVSPYWKRGMRESFSPTGVRAFPHPEHNPLRNRKRKKKRVFEVNEKLEIQVTTINSETLHKINYSFASEARMWISDSQCHLSRAAQYTRRLKSQICPPPRPKAPRSLWSTND